MTEEFKQLTIELLMHKYLFYEVEKPLINNYKYEQLKSRWMAEGERQGVDLKKLMERPGFDYHHPFAKQAIIMAKKAIGA